MAYFSMTHNLNHLMPHIWQKIFSHKTWCLNSREYMMLQKNLKGKWVVIYGIEVSTPYGIDEGMLSTYRFFLPPVMREND